MKPKIITVTCKGGARMLMVGSLLVVRDKEERLVRRFTAAETLELLIAIRFFYEQELFHRPAIVSGVRVVLTIDNALILRLGSPEIRCQLADHRFRALEEGLQKSMGLRAYFDAANAVNSSAITFIVALPDRAGGPTAGESQI